MCECIKEEIKELKFTKVRDVKSPQRANPYDAGIDFFIPNDIDEIELFPGQSVLIPSGIKVDVPKGYALIAFNKSGIATKYSLIVGACVVDHGYQGEVHIHMLNVGEKCVKLRRGMKIVQFILLPIMTITPKEVPIDEMYTNIVGNRGDGGFGSTGG